MASIGQVTPPILPEAGQLPPEDQGLIERFKARIAEFREVFARLRGIGEQIPAPMQGEYQDLINRGNTIESTITTVTDGINTAVNWFRGAFGLDAVNMAQRGQLGLIPLLPVAAITGALALIGYWITDTMAFMKRVDAMVALVQQGYTPTEAAEAVKEAATKPPIFGLDLQQWIVPALILGGVWWFSRGRGF